MSVIAHLSDLHFGCHDPAAAESLVASVTSAAPDLVVVTGDLTQRAREGQFAAAGAFLARLPQPVLAVPGNHDVPLYDLWRRAFDPLGRFRRYISPEPMPLLCDADMAVIGINTARSAAFAGGRISREQAAAVARIFSTVPPPRIRIAAFHHPLRPPATAPHLPVVGRADMAIAAFVAAGVRVVLTGHYHRSYSSLMAPLEPSPRSDLLLIHAGTAMSLRRRDEANSYNLLEAAPGRVRCTTYRLEGARFVPAQTGEYDWGESGWTAHPPSPPG